MKGTTLVSILKAHTNGRNIIGQQHPTLRLGPTMLRLVASACMGLRPNELYQVHIRDHGVAPPPPPNNIFKIIKSQ